MATKSGYKGISRVDNPKRKAHGWYVRVTKEGKTYGRFLSDSAHGGEQKALKKAVRARNELERDLGKPRTDRVIMPPRKKKNRFNTTGIVGVNLIDVGPEGAFEVTWSPEPGKLARTKSPSPNMARKKRCAAPSGCDCARNARFLAQRFIIK
jgi:hypothetical protein